MEFEFWGIDEFSGTMNMGIDEYMTQCSSESNSSILRFYTVRDAMGIGYGQRLKILKDKPEFEIFRRITGGSQVQGDSSTLMYSLATPHETFESVRSLRTYIDERIAKGLRDLGISSAAADVDTATIDIDGKVVGGDSMIRGKKNEFNENKSDLLQGILVINPYDVEKISKRMPLKSRIIDGEVYREYDALKNLPPISTCLDGVIKHDAMELVTDSILQRLTGGSYKEVKQNNGFLNEAKKFVDRRYGRRSWLENQKPDYEKGEIEESPGEELQGPLKTREGYCFYVLVKDPEFKIMAQKEENASQIYGNNLS